MVSTSFCIHVVCQIIYFVMYVPGYADLVPAYDKYRINQGVNRAWEGNPHWGKTRNKLLFYLGLNYLVIYPMMIVVSTYVSGIKVRF